MTKITSGSELHNALYQNFNFFQFKVIWKETQTPSFEIRITLFNLK